MAKERTCMMCGRHYQFCRHCKEYEHEPRWKYLYHDEKCKAIGDLWYAYRGNEISKSEAKKAMSAFKPNINDVLRYTSIAANEIREIFASNEDVVNMANSQSTTNSQEVENASEVKEIPEVKENVVQDKPTKRRGSKKDNHESE